MCRCPFVGLAADLILDVWFSSLCVARNAHSYLLYIVFIVVFYTVCVGTLISSLNCSTHH